MMVARQFTAWNACKRWLVREGPYDRSQAIHCLGHAPDGIRPVGDGVIF
jgi:hypothetical protein